MTTTAEHLNYTPGLADGICPAHCAHLLWVFGAAGCTAFDAGLKQTGDRRALRCQDCLNHGINNDHHHED